MLQSKEAMKTCPETEKAFLGKMGEGMDTWIK